MWIATLLVAALPPAGTSENIRAPSGSSELTTNSVVAREWTPLDARELLARAGFAPTPDEVRRAAEAGREKTIDRLFEERAPRTARDSIGLGALHGDLPDPGQLCDRLDSRREGYLQLQSDHIAPLSRYGVR